MTYETLVLTINGLKVTERKMTFQQALDLGVFDGEHFVNDWTGRAKSRPHDDVYVYSNDGEGSAGGVLLGYCDGEGAMFCTLHEWVTGYFDSIRPKFASVDFEDGRDGGERGDFNHNLVR